MTAGGTATTRSTQFRTTALRFAVPATAYNALSFTAPAALTPRAWATIDLTNDGRVDLVLTSDPATGAVFNNNGGRYWNVHAGTPTGFSAMATQYPVPATASIAQGYNTTTSATGTFFWSTLDMNGDGRPELVQTMNALGGGPAISVIGATADGWMVFRGNATGFDAATTMFTVPRVTNLSGGVDRTTNDTAARRWALAQLNADTIPDLVITADPLTDAVWTASTTPQWVVCPGSMAGFGTFSSCQRLQVPDNGVAGGFKSTTSIVPTTRRVWLLSDLDGDGRDDLIQTANPLALTTTTFLNGTTPTWKVWFNAFSATSLFAAVPTQWTVPAAMFATPFSATAPNFWQLMDLDGDGVQELVQTADPATGRPFTTTPSGPSWRVYFATGRAGFSTIATLWPVPVGPTPDGFRSVSGTSWAVTDMTGDGLPDLVQFQDPATGLAFSDSNGAFWRVYQGF